jgi:head-tail adaptor
MTIATALTQTLTIQRLNASRDEIGGTVPGIASSADVSGYIEPVTGEEDLVNRNTPIGEWMGYVPAGTDVATEDRVAYSGHTFEVEAVEPFSHWGGAGIDHIRLRLREVR